MSLDGYYWAVPQHNFNIGFFGCGKTLEAMKSDLQNSYEEAKRFCNLPEDVLFEYIFEANG